MAERFHQNLPAPLVLHTGAANAKELSFDGLEVDSNSRLLLEKKVDMRKRVGFSPDLGDALALTFAETIRRDAGRRPRVSSANSRYDPLRWRMRA